MTPAAATLHAMICVVSVAAAITTAYRNGFFTDEEQEQATEAASIRDWVAERAVTDGCASCSTSCCRWWLLNVVMTVLTLADFAADVLYVATVPTYNQIVWILLLVSLGLTQLVNFCIAYAIADQTEDRICARICMVVEGFAALGTGNYHVFTIRRGIRRDHSYSAEAKYLNGFVLAALENLPQFLLQTVNTMLIGQKLSFVQIISPAVSAVLLSIRAVDVAKPGATDEIVATLKTRCVIYSNIVTHFVFLTGTFMLVLACYEYSDHRVAWAQQFEINQYGQTAYYYKDDACFHIECALDKISQ